jgi:LmbE family N-acetylglucosaminyl deacetylase
MPTNVTRPIPPAPTALQPTSHPSAGELLEALEDGAAIDAAACVVVAHPDDETIGLGARLASFRSLRLVHLTDGAPEDPSDAQRAGYGDASAYAGARAAELQRALAILGARSGSAALGLRDQTAVHHLAWLVQALAPRLADFAVVVTHAYEGGHPDHDAAACAVQTACAALARAGRLPPVRLEFAGYHLADGRRVTGGFWPDPARPAVTAHLTPRQRARKRRALAAFRTQAEVLAWFDPDVETYREAPAYDFSRPPPTGAALYDEWNWTLNSARWRDLARAALADLGEAA